MPKISLNQKGGSIIYDQSDWLAGLDTTSAGANFGKMDGNPSMVGVTPLRLFGYMSPCFNPTDVTNIASVTAFVRNGVVAGDKAYIIGSNSLFYELTNLATGTITSQVGPPAWPHTISHGGHSSVTGNDVAIYYTNVAGTQTQRVFYSFTDATDWDVGIYNVVAQTFDDDFMSTIPTSPLASPYLAGGAGFPHPLIVGDDDVLYMGDRNFVHAYDGQTNTFYPAVLTLPTGWIITCFATTNDIHLAIGAYTSSSSGTNTFNRGQAKVWIWNYLDLDPNYAINLRDNYVSEIISWAGTIGAFTSGRYTVGDAGKNKLQALEGSEFKVVKTWNTGGLPIRGGVDSVKNDLYWNAEGRVYSYIQRPDNGKYILGTETATGSGSSGMLRFFTATSTIHYSFGSTSGSALEYLSSNYNTGTMQAQVAAPEFPVRQRGKLMAVTVAYAQATSGGREFELLTLLDRSSTSTIASTATISSQRVARFTTQADGTPLGKFNTLQPSFNWSGGIATSAPQIEWIRYDFEFINV